MMNRSETRSGFFKAYEKNNHILICFISFHLIEF